MGVGSSSNSGDRGRSQISRRGPDLLDYAWRCDWSNLSQRLQSCPQEAFTLNYNGRTALHLACFRKPPLETVKELIKANPHALFRLDHRSKHTPLHLLCRFGADDTVICEVVDEMIRIFSRDYKDKKLRETMRMMLVTGDIVNIWDDDHSESGDFFKSTFGEKVHSPLNLACLRGASVRTMEKLSLDMNETVFKFGLATSHQLIDALEESLGAVWSWFEKQTDLEVPLSQARQDWLSSETNKDDAAETFCTSFVKIDILLEQIARKRGIGASLSVHTVASLHRSLPDLLGFTLRFFPDQVRQCDRNGDLPFHLFLRNNCITTNWAKGIEVLLDAYPCSAGIRDRNKELPLMLLIKRNRQWSQGVAHVLKFHPESLSLFDKEYNFLPFMLVAINSNYPIDMVYLLLRSYPPAVVAYLIGLK